MAFVDEDALQVAALQRAKLDVLDGVDLSDELARELGVGAQGRGDDVLRVVVVGRVFSVALLRPSASTSVFIRPLRRLNHAA